MKNMRFAIATSLICLLVAAQGQANEPSIEDRTAVHAIDREEKISRVLDAVSKRASRGTLIIRDVSVVDVSLGRTIPHQSVVTKDGRIFWVGDAGSTPTLAAAAVIDGAGHFLSPGLADMHVHTQSLSEQLLRLATGVTSVRDMDGFPWMLRLRRAIRAGLLLAPADYIAGTIIADYPLSGFAVVVKSAQEARQVVRDQASCGYDFVKVHNRLSQPLFDAVADEARRSGRDLIGHIPHDITIDHAVHVGGMRTLEHLKGFINDGDLRVSDEDYASALKGAHVWLTPTFYVLRRLHDESARRELARPEMRYVPATHRAEWRRPDNFHLEPDWHDRIAALLPTSMVDVLPLYSPQILERRLRESVPRAMARLLPLHPHWLAGTDSAQYDFQVAGYALLDELQLMERNGIARVDVLRAATLEPAAAMRQTDEFGQIKPGMRADLVLLADDPTVDLAAFRTNLGVMAKGVWLDRHNIDEALEDLAKIQAEGDAQFALNKSTADALAAAVLQWWRQGITLDPRLLTPAALALSNQGYASAAATLTAAENDAAPGPCRESLPENGD
jgi:hypothetical protein